MFFFYGVAKARWRLFEPSVVPGEHHHVLSRFMLLRSAAMRRQGIRGWIIYEVLEAVRFENPLQVTEERGDVLEQLATHRHIFRGRGSGRLFPSILEI